ncbi:MAG: hypothetical protein V1748_12115 [Actinomycetota bacterium]
MICPRCGSETSDMRPACEWCHTPLFSDSYGVHEGQPPADAGQGAGSQPGGYWQEQPGGPQQPVPGAPQQPAGGQPAYQYPPRYDPGAQAPAQAPTWSEPVPPPVAPGVPPPSNPYAGGYPPGGYDQGQQYPGGYPPGGYIAPGDASYRPPGPPELPRPVASGKGDPFYLQPWPYIVALLLVGLIVGGVFLAQKASTKSYADLVVGNRPTLLDFYTDT